MMFWSEFGVLFVTAIIGSAAIIPYSLRLAQGKPPKFSFAVLSLLSILQGAALFGVAIWLGLSVARTIGLGAPYLEALVAGVTAPSSIGLSVAFILGLVVGGVLLVVDLSFVPYWPQALLDAASKTTLLDNFLASLYGGINEELLVRLFGFSALAWLLSFVWRLNPAILWMVNIIMTIIFGAGHLPALKGVIGNLPPLMIARSLILNAPVGLLCGWLFWTYGIEAAIFAHFSADLVYHVFGAVVLRRKIR